MDPALTAAAIGVGGTVIVGVAGFWANVRNTNKTTALALRAIEVTEQGQVTDRYSKAIEQLGSDKGLDVCIGGIYALERIARDSPGTIPRSWKPWRPSSATTPASNGRRPRRR